MATPEDVKVKMLPATFKDSAIFMMKTMVRKFISYFNTIVYTVTSVLTMFTGYQIFKMSCEMDISTPFKCSRIGL